jgi:hypothetical protein
LQGVARVTCGRYVRATRAGRRGYMRGRTREGGGEYIKRASIIMRGGPVPTSPERFWIGLG